MNQSRSLKQIETAECDSMLMTQAKVMSTGKVQMHKKLVLKWQDPCCGEARTWRKSDTLQLLQNPREMSSSDESFHVGI